MRGGSSYGVQRILSQVRSDAAEYAAMTKMSSGAPETPADAWDLEFRRAMQTIQQLEKEDIVLRHSRAALMTSSDRNLRMSLADGRTMPDLRFDWQASGAIPGQVVLKNPTQSEDNVAKVDTSNNRDGSSHIPQTIPLLPNGLCPGGESRSSQGLVNLDEEAAIFLFDRTAQRAVTDNPARVGELRQRKDFAELQSVNDAEDGAAAYESDTVRRKAEREEAGHFQCVEVELRGFEGQQMQGFEYELLRRKVECNQESSQLAGREAEEQRARQVQEAAALQREEEAEQQIEQETKESKEREAELARHEAEKERARQKQEAEALQREEEAERQRAEEIEQANQKTEQETKESKEREAELARYEAEKERTRQKQEAEALQREEAERQRAEEVKQVQKIAQQEIKEQEKDEQKLREEERLQREEVSAKSTEGDTFLSNFRHAVQIEDVDKAREFLIQATRSFQVCGPSYRQGELDSCKTELQSLLTRKTVCNIVLCLSLARSEMTSATNAPAIARARNSVIEARRLLSQIPKEHAKEIEKLSEDISLLTNEINKVELDAAAAKDSDSTDVFSQYMQSFVPEQVYEESEQGSDGNAYDVQSEHASDGNVYDEDETDDFGI